MKTKFLISFFVLAASLAAIGVEPQARVRGANLTEIGEMVYDAATGSQPKTEAQKRVDELFDLGIRMISLSPRATMSDPRGSELIPMVPLKDRRKEFDRYLRLIRYIRSKGMQVGIRPIFFVVDANGQTPFVETQADGSRKIWWHGNIQPGNPDQWFESFKTYLDRYLFIAKSGQVEEFTIGAELYSMTVGIEDQWKANPYGFPHQWLQLLKYSRAKLPEGCRIMYDINFTDDKLATATAGNLEQFGGEFARWKYRLVDLAEPKDPKQREVWQNLVEFWKGLDAVGIDLYRSLATHGQEIPTDQTALTAMLKQTADRYASQIDNALFEIQGVTGAAQKVILKEIGYRSIEKSFIDPFFYAGQKEAKLNILHQASAYDAILQAFWAADMEWFQGIEIWDASVEPKLHGPTDTGFSPLGKDLTEKVFRKYFK